VAGTNIYAQSLSGSYDKYGGKFELEWVTGTNPYNVRYGLLDPAASSSSKGNLPARMVAAGII
jgi:hypothetical protein